MEEIGLSIAKTPSHTVLALSHDDEIGNDLAGV